MPYTKTTWTDDVTPISATNLNKIEQGITDAVPNSDVVTTPTANAILRLNASGILPASVTGDAGTVGGKAIAELGYGTWEKIAEQTLSGVVAQVNFASIPSGYKRFKLMFESVSNTTTSGDMFLVLNDDATTNYRYQHIVGSASTVTAASDASTTLMAITNALPSNLLSRAVGTLEISNANALKPKIINGEWFVEIATGTNMRKYLFGGVWGNITTEINKISVKGVLVSIGIGSRFVLWGCK